MTNHLKTLKAFQDWRTGKDERTMDEAGIEPKAVTAAIDYALHELELQQHMIETISRLDDKARELEFRIKLLEKQLAYLEAQQ